MYGENLPYSIVITVHKIDCIEYFTTRKFLVKYTIIHDNTRKIIQHDNTRIALFRIQILKSYVYFKLKYFTEYSCSFNLMSLKFLTLLIFN